MEQLEQEIMQSRHQFIYGTKEEREKLISSLAKNYPLTPKKDTPSVVQIKYPGFPVLKENNGKDPITLTCLARDYLEYTMALNTVQQCNERHFLEREKVLAFFERVNQFNPNRFEKNMIDQDMSDTDIDDFIYSLNVTRKIYRKMYEEYLKTGNIKMQNIPIEFLPFSLFLDDFNRMIENTSYIAYLIHYNKPMSLNSIKAMNDLINMRSNKVVSIKLFCEKDSWPTYYGTNGEFIQKTHDFGEVDITEHFTRKLQRKQN